MRYLIFTIIIIILTCCSNDKNKSNEVDSGPHYTEEQISSLGLDSTALLDIKKDGLISIDIASYLKEGSYHLDSIITEVKLIPLETKPKSIISTINEVIITDSHIYVYDEFKEGGIIIFERDGSFIKRIENGKGPGELSRLYDIDFDKSTHQLIAYKHSFLVFYTESGEFIREERTPFGFMNFKILPDGYAFYLLRDQGNEHLGPIEKYQLLVTDRNLKIRSAGLPDTGFECLGNTNYLHDAEQNDFFITQKCNDTIYQYSPESEQLRGKYLLSYEEKMMPAESLKDTYEIFKTEAQENDYYFNIGRYFDTGDYHAFSLFSWYHDHEIVLYRNKTSRKVIGGSNVRFNLNELPLITFPKAVASDYFVTWYHPGEDDLFARNSKIISEEDKFKIQDLTINDNPVLVFYKLKDF